MRMTRVQMMVRAESAAVLVENAAAPEDGRVAVAALRAEAMGTMAETGTVTALGNVAFFQLITLGISTSANTPCTKILTTTWSQSGSMTPCIRTLARCGMGRRLVFLTSSSMPAHSLRKLSILPTVTKVIQVRSLFRSTHLSKVARIVQATDM